MTRKNAKGRLSKRAECRSLFRAGYTVSEIAQRMNMHPSNVSHALKGHKGGRGSAASTATFRPWKRKEPIHGRCLKKSVIDGQIVECGATCPGQYCDEHKDTTAPIAPRWIGGRVPS